ncbi:MAG TPA: hypothetical protein VNH11_27580 [Pirellulales bacterium]|nr:hypothetical protein [Pirellulales bacterium]
MAIADNGPAAATFAFTVILEGLDDIGEDLTNRLFEAGCSDASLGCCDGVVSLEFDRQAVSLADAIGSAVRDITAAGCLPAQITLDRDGD